MENTRPSQNTVPAPPCSRPHLTHILSALQMTAISAPPCPILVLAPPIFILVPHATTQHALWPHTF